MSDIISIQAAIDEWKNDFKGYVNALNIPRDDYRGIIEYIDELPSAEPVQHEECEYIITKGKAGYHEEYKCSVCGDSFYWTQDRNIPSRFNYCRNCGRKVIRFVEKEASTAKRESE